MYAPIASPCIMTFITMRPRARGGGGRTKAIRLWTAANEWQRVLVCASYFTATGWEQIEAREVTLDDGHDPMFVVTAVRPADDGAGSPKSEL